MLQRLDPEIEQYRSLARAPGPFRFRVAIKESDLEITCDRPLEALASGALARNRAELEAYCEAYPAFVSALVPLAVHERAPRVVRHMARAARTAGVGPMAAVAGALAEAVGRTLLVECGEVIVENGGDLFCCVRKPRTVALDAGASNLGAALGLRVRPEMGPVGICTSSGTLGGSLSFGRADAACVIARDAALADAAATAVGNVVSTPADIEASLARARSIRGVLGALVVVGGHIGAWGAVELVGL